MHKLNLAKMYKLVFKRFIDFIAALVVMILLLPVYILVSVAIAIKLGTPVIFSQERPGKDAQPFKLYKFRSMTNDTDEHGQLLSNEKRLTGFGKKLRATSLDELPSLWNVLKGEMSLVGPRPLRMRYLPYYSKEQYQRHNVKPGITGYAQANGRSNLNWDEKLNMDVKYVKNFSFVLDVKIVCKTFWNVVRTKDTKPEGSSFEMAFDDYVKQKANA